MKKRLIILVTLFIPFILLSTTIIVDENGSGDYSTIQEAIDIGRYYYPHTDYDIHHLSKGYNWESFPRIGIEFNNNDETNIIPILEEIEPDEDITNIVFDANGTYDLTWDFINFWRRRRN